MFTFRGKNNQRLSTEQHKYLCEDNWNVHFPSRQKILFSFSFFEKFDFSAHLKCRRKSSRLCQMPLAHSTILWEISSFLLGGFLPLSLFSSQSSCSLGPPLSSQVAQTIFSPAVEVVYLLRVGKSAAAQVERVLSISVKPPPSSSWSTKIVRLVSKGNCSLQQFQPIDPLFPAFAHLKLLSEI